mgnify:CR=1 FL=1|tara:strand:- start:302 stop:793 length:492 start_codon:yes stop_codon:yes gene_type:complete
MAPQIPFHIPWTPDFNLEMISSAAKSFLMAGGMSNIMATVLARGRKWDRPIFPPTLRVTESRKAITKTSAIELYPIIENLFIEAAEVGILNINNYNYESFVEDLQQVKNHWVEVVERNINTGDEFDVRRFSQSRYQSILSWEIEPPTRMLFLNWTENPLEGNS